MTAERERAIRIAAKETAEALKRRPFRGHPGMGWERRQTWRADRRRQRRSQPT